MKTETLILLVLFFPVLGFSQLASVSTSPLDLNRLQTFSSETRSDLYGLEVWYSSRLSSWLPIIPPAPGFVLFQPSGEVLPFQWKHFPAAFLDKLSLTYEKSVPAYRVWIQEDPVSRYLRFYNEDGEFLDALPPPAGHRTPDFQNDPSRLSLGVTLIPSEYIEPYLYAEQQIEAYQSSLASESLPPDSSPQMMYSGPPVTELTMTSIEETTNGIMLTVAYPISFTNEIDILFTHKLVDAYYTLADTLSTDFPNDWVEWTNSLPTSGNRYYIAADADTDSDSDGTADGRERFIYHSDEYDSNSYPASVSGTISYSGSESGEIYVLGTENSNDWSIAQSVNIPAPGGYTNLLMANNQDYWLKSFRDVDGNAKRSVWEPQEVYSTNALYLDQNKTEIDITLEDQPSIWGEITLSGTNTGNIHVLITTNAASWSNEEEVVLDWITGYSDTGSSSPIFLELPADYALFDFDPGSYYVKAFMDENDDGMFTADEPAAAYSSSALLITSRMLGLNLNLAVDSDEDGLPDWWEQIYGPDLSPGGDPDGDTLLNSEEYGLGTDPLVFNTVVKIGGTSSQPFGQMMAMSGESIPASASLLYKTRKATRHKFQRFPAFVQPTNEPPVYFLGYGATDNSDWRMTSQPYCPDYTERERSTFTANYTVHAKDMTVSGEADSAFEQLSPSSNGWVYIGGYIGFNDITVTSNQVEEISWGDPEDPVYVTNTYCWTGHPWLHYPTSYALNHADATVGMDFVYLSIESYTEDEIYCTTNDIFQSYTLSQPYTRSMLEQYTDEDFQTLTNYPWTGFGWGSNVQHTVESDPCSPKTAITNDHDTAYSARNLHTNETSLTLSETAFRFEVDTEPDQVYELTWIEHFVPDATSNPDGIAEVLDVKTIKFKGTGGVVYLGDFANENQTVSSQYTIIGGPDANDDFVLDPPSESQGNGRIEVDLLHLSLNSTNLVVSVEQGEQTIKPVSSSNWGQNYGANLIWTATPSGLGDINTVSNQFTFTPSNSVPGVYKVRAESPLSPTIFDECEVIVIRIDLRAHLPITEGPSYGNPFQQWWWEENEEETPGAGIRVNGDFDASGENDTIEAHLIVQPFPIPDGVKYYLRRNNSNIKVWSSQNMEEGLLDSGTEIAITINSPSMPVWVENPNGGVADLKLVAKDRSDNDVYYDKVHFYPFSSIVIALGGEDQNPSDPAATGRGIFQLAIDLYSSGYDVHMYNEDRVSNNGDGVVYDEVVSAIQNRSVTQVAIFGYSHGGGSTHDLALRLDNNRATIGSFSIPFTAYIDGIQNISDLNTDPELRRPQSSGYHVNYYQEGSIDDFWLDGGPINTPGANHEDNVDDPSATHFHHTIDDDFNILGDIETRLRSQLSK